MKGMTVVHLKVAAHKLGVLATLVVIVGCSSVPAKSQATQSSGPDFFCSESGAEKLPWALALDLDSGSLKWTVCADEDIPPWLFGRTTDRSLLWQQDGFGRAETIALDDNGEVMWRHASDGNSPRMLIGANIVVSTVDDVEAIGVEDGVVLWHHPIAEGTPFGIGNGLVVEIAGGPYAAPGSQPSPADAGQATLRAVDELTGEERWAIPVTVAPLPPPNQYSPTAGTTVLAIPSTATQGTLIVDSATGEIVRQEQGVVMAVADLLVRIDPNTSVVLAVSDADTGAVLEGVSGQPVSSYMMDAEHSPPLDDVFVFSVSPDTNRTTYEMVDRATSAVRWTLDIGEGYPSAQSADGILVSAQSALRLLDRQTGAVIWEYTSPSTSIGFQSAAFGDDIVVVTPQLLGD